MGASHFKVGGKEMEIFISRTLGLKNWLLSVIGFEENAYFPYVGMKTIELVQLFTLHVFPKKFLNIKYRIFSIDPLLVNFQSH